ncbi:MAG: helix-turn-helix transcriptional regulator [Ruegeria sp.]|uniref:helix-turn-helix transcriptional regulator n=1 Tax=Ruegeria sp. TaxID=1879320 RepID=UPI00349ED297
MTRNLLVIALLVVQVACALFFVFDILSSVLGLPIGPINWHAREIIEIGAALGLILGIVVGFVVLRQSVAEAARMKTRLKAAQSAFSDLLEESFTAWHLTPAERDVALFAIKGMTTAEIAALRNTSEGTVKAQTNAIYRKAGVHGRSQLLGLFIDNLMADDLQEREPESDQVSSSA